MEEPVEVVAPWDGRRVPVTLLGGYLGAGKTTVLNAVLARTDRPIAVLVNDIGAVNIDASLVRRRNSDTIELTDGCVCCSLTAGLAAAFDGIRSRPEPPDHVILELSGVADPARVTPWADSDGFRLDGVVVLVDAEQFIPRLDDAVTGPAVRNQVVAADLLVVSKVDLVTGEQLQETVDRLGDVAPGVPILHADDAIATASFLDLGTRRPAGIAATPPTSLFDVHEVHTRAVPQPIERADFERMIESLPASTLRAKGIAITPDGTRLLAQVVGRRRLVTDLPAAEGQAPTDLVVITARR
jgi:G3E family GTPase